jgi:hypothetical protein
MQFPHYPLVHGRVSEEIRRVVADAIGGGGCCLPAGRYAAVIARAFPNCGITADQIADEIVEAAIRAGINVEISKPRHEVFRTPACSLGDLGQRNGPDV